MGLQVSLCTRTRISVREEDLWTDVAAGPPVTLLPHVDHRLVQPAVDRPVLGSLKYFSIYIHFNGWI